MNNETSEEVRASIKAEEAGINFCSHSCMCIYLKQITGRTRTPTIYYLPNTINATGSVSVNKDWQDLVIKMVLLVFCVDLCVMN